LLLLLHLATVRPELLKCLEPRELARLAGLCRFAYAQVTTDTGSLNAVNPWKLNPVRDYAHFRKLGWQGAGIQKGLMAAWPRGVGVKRQMCEWLTRAPRVLDLDYCQIDERCGIVFAWRLWRRENKNYWLLGQVNCIGEP
jgi:hypothetical protein